MPTLILNGRAKRKWQDTEVVYEDLYIDTDDDGDEIYGRLHIKLSHEGVIIDLEDSVTGEILETWAKTADELVDMVCRSR